MLNSFDKASVNKILRKITTDIAWIQKTQQGLAKTNKDIRNELVLAFVIAIFFNMLTLGLTAWLLILKFSP